MNGRASLRTRVALAAAGAVVLAIVLVSVGAFVTTRRQLDGDLDRGLLRVAELVAELDPVQRERLLAELADERPGRRGPVGPRLLDRAGPDAERLDGLLGPLGGAAVQLVAADGRATSLLGPALPVDATTTRIATGPRPDDEQPYVRDTARLDDRPVRLVAVAVEGGGAVQVAARLDASDPALGVLRRALTLLGLLAALLAGGLGLLAADRAVRPVRALRRTAEQVGRTGDLTTRIPVEGDDELARLAASFNQMLAGLEQARSAQQQLVADASHELRTPLTSLRTNLEVLQLDAGRLDPDDRDRLLRDLVAQLGEMGRLVDGLVELARGDEPARGSAPVDLGTLVEDVVERARVFHPDVPIEVTVDRSVVVVERDRVERAVANLVDNAVKHGGGTPVEVSVVDGAVTVRDHGPGMDEDDLPRVFERFWRAPAARSLPGSGLGLSIVAQVAEAHGGSTHVRTHPGGGAELVLRLPTAPAEQRS